MNSLENIAGGCNKIVNTLGMQHFKSSGTYYDAASSGMYAARHAKLHNSKCWSARNSPKNTNQWLQIDLGTVVTIQGFATQGHGDELDDNISSSRSSWCETIRFETSNDASSWFDHGTFQCNEGPNDVKSNKLSNACDARYVRFYPQQCGGYQKPWAKLRAEIFWTGDYVLPTFDVETEEEKKQNDEDEDEDDIIIVNKILDESTNPNANQVFFHNKKTSESWELEEEEESTQKEINQDAAAYDKGLVSRESKKDDEDDIELILPDPPGISVTMSTELVRLRGGPYWVSSESGNSVVLLFFFFILVCRCFVVVLLLLFFVQTVYFTNTYTNMLLFLFLFFFFSLSLSLFARSPKD